MSPQGRDPASREIAHLSSRTGNIFSGLGTQKCQIAKRDLIRLGVGVAFDFCLTC